MDELELAYVTQMNAWIKEQAVLEEQIKRAIEYHEDVANYHKEVAELNKTQLNAHKERVELGIKEFEEWKRDNDIEGDNGQ